MMSISLINTTACDGTSFFWEWLLWLLGAFLFGLLIGWLLRSIFGDKENKYPEDYEQLKIDLDNCRVDKRSVIHHLNMAWCMTLSLIHPTLSFSC